MDDSSRHPELEAEVRKLELTPGATAWLKKALYPPGVGTSVSFPDGAYNPCVRGDYRPSKVIVPPDGLLADETWDCCIVTLPGDCNAAVVMKGLSGVVNFATGSAVYAEWLRNIDSGGSNTVLGAGRTVAGDASPITVNATFSSTQTQAFRSTYKSLTVHMTASSLYDGGSVTAAQFPIEWPLSSQFIYTMRNGSNYAAIPSWAPLPLDEQHMRQMAPGSHVGEARAGVYMPLRLRGPSQPFVGLQSVGGRWYTPASTSNIYNTVTTPVASALYLPVAAYASIAVTQSAGYTTGVSTLGSGSATGLISDPAAVDDTNYDNFNTGVIIFRGLSPQATLTIQAYQGLEMCVFPTSALASFARSPEIRDDRALAAYSAIVSRMGYVYPAKYNALGLILPLIATALRAALPYVVPAVRSLAGMAIPALASAAMARIGATPAQRAPSVSSRPRSTAPANKPRVRLGSLPPAKQRKRKR